MLSNNSFIIVCHDLKNPNYSYIRLQSADDRMRHEQRAIIICSNRKHALWNQRCSESTIPDYERNCSVTFRNRSAKQCYYLAEISAEIARGRVENDIIEISTAPSAESCRAARQSG